MSKHTKIKGNFVYPEIKHTDRTYGSTILGAVVKEDGDWRDFLPPEEDQNVRGIESSACFAEGQQHTIATLQEFLYDLPDQNYSARFTALLANGTENGGDPIRAAKSIKYDGLVPEEDMTWKFIESWDEFHSWKGVDKLTLIAKGKQWANQWKPNFKIIVEREDSIESKYLKMREALKRSPLPISVCAWYEKNGVYVKPNKMRDNHMVEAVFLDNQNRLHVRDTYTPYYKILEPNYNVDFAMSYVLYKSQKANENWVVDLFKRIFLIK